MQVPIRIIVAALIAAVSIQADADAQWRDGPRRGLFGEREFGKPFKPRESRFGSQIERGPSGNFLGKASNTPGTTFRTRIPVEPAPRLLLPPEAYDLEPDMMPSFLEEQARRMAEAQQRVAPVQPPVAVPVPRPQRYLPPPWLPLPTQPGYPQPQPGVPGPTKQELRNSPDRWFRGTPSPSQPGGPNAATPPATMPRGYMPGMTLSPAGSLGPAGVPGQSGLNRPNTATLGARINATLGARARSPISVVQQGESVTLQGVVAAPADRQFAERMAAMEPGVRAVNNRITVQAAPPAQP